MDLTWSISETYIIIRLCNIQYNKERQSYRKSNGYHQMRDEVFAGLAKNNQSLLETNLASAGPKSSR